MERLKQVRENIWWIRYMSESYYEKSSFKINDIHAISEI